MINFSLVNTQNQQVLATIRQGRVEITEEGKAEMLKLEPCPKFGGSELVAPEDKEYANAFFLFIINTVLPAHEDWEWKKETESSADLRQG